MDDFNAEECIKLKNWYATTEYKIKSDLWQNKLLVFDDEAAVDIDSILCDIENENLIYEFSFLDSNMSKALNLYSELFAVPNFFDLQNLNQIIK